MKNFPEKQQDNVPGIRYFWYVPQRHVISVPDPVGWNIQDPIVLSDTVKFYKGYSTLNKLQFEEPEEESVQGSLQRQRLTGFVPNDTPEITELLAEMMDEKYFCVIYKDNNGRYKLLQHMRFKADLDNSDFATANGHSFTFYRAAPKKAYFYTSIFEVDDTILHYFFGNYTVIFGQLASLTQTFTITKFGAGAYKNLILEENVTSAVVTKNGGAPTTDYNFPEGTVVTITITRPAAGLYLESVIRFTS